MAGAVEMGMAEANDGVVEILVTGAIAVNIRVVFAILLIRNGVGIGAELHKPERDTGAGEGMAHLLGANEGVDEINTRGFWRVGLPLVDQPAD